MKQGQFPAILPLASLDGQNGFKIQGKSCDNTFGNAVSTAGDINGDGYSDLIIGSPYGSGGVVFGGPGVGNSGLIIIANLDGTNGFFLSGGSWEVGAGVGAAVGAAGDVNGDGYADFVIGNPGLTYAMGCAGNSVGRSYVVFGGPGVGSSGTILLSNLNGANGFKLEGESGFDYSGGSVSTAGDINGDGYSDVFIGSYNHGSTGCGDQSGYGRSYVVFGGPNVGGVGSIMLSNLNGTNGYKLDGELNGDLSSFSIKGTGDINHDGHTDLLIGAYGYPYGGSGGILKGRSYVVFGGPGVGSEGLFNLSSLNGLNGFKLNGEASGDKSGYSVSVAGDINGDGHVDLLIGSPYAASSISGATGRTYVVFGGPGVGSSGILVLLNLNGTNGFKIDGDFNGGIGSSGSSVSSAGDINGDGYADILLGAPFGAPSGSSGDVMGRTYVVFGGSGVGNNGIFPLSTLDGVNGFSLKGELTVNGLSSCSGYSVSSAGDVNGDGVSDIIIGTNVQGCNYGYAYVVFGDVPPVLVQNRLTLQSGSTVPLNSTFLSAYDRNHNNNTLMFIPSALTHGDFELVSQPGVALDNFTQPQLLNGSIQFVHDGSSIPPSYNMTVRSAGIAWTGPSPAQITFIAAPVLQRNSLTINQGQQILLTSAQLEVIDFYPTNQVNLTISNLTHGQFILSPSNTSVLQFTEEELNSSQVKFIHDNSSYSPSYSVSVSDPYFMLPPAAADITFYDSTITTGVPSSSPSSTPSSTSTSVSPGTSTPMPTNTPSSIIPSSTPSSTATAIPSMIPSSTPSSIPSTPTLTPSSTPLNTPQTSPENASLVPIIAGIAGGGTAILLLFLCCLYRRFKKNRSRDSIKEVVKMGDQPSPASPLVSPDVDQSKNGGEGVELSSLPSVTSPFLPRGESVHTGRELTAHASSILSLSEKSQEDLSASYLPHTLSVSQSGKPDSEVVKELKVSRRSVSPSSPRSVDEAGEMKISLSLAYQDLEFDEKDKLGSGAYGTVYKGIYKFNEVAIKQLHVDHLSEGATDELKQEAGILGSMRSDYIVSLRGICLEAPHFCLVMELMPKGSLYNVLQNSPGELPLSVRYRIGLDVCYGLYHLHEMNILHRDLKSLNVLLDDRFRAKITDFGLSKMKSEMGSMSSSKGMKGTLGWMAPELFSEKPEATSAADMYAYGMVLFELMANPHRIPFQGLAPASVITAKLMRGDKQETISDSCPPKMAQLMRACWQEPEKRPSAKVLAKSLSSLFKASQSQQETPKVASLPHFDPLKSEVPGYDQNLASFS